MTTEKPDSSYLHIIILCLEKTGTKNIKHCRDEIHSRQGTDWEMKMRKGLEEQPTIEYTAAGTWVGGIVYTEWMIVEKQNKMSGQYKNKEEERQTRRNVRKCIGEYSRQDKLEWGKHSGKKLWSVA